ncbi:MAG: penicillin-binding protein 2 [Acidimicrobiaceae bacterium]|nr:penicillin-binding protein 2 [Acidimicrobiaceae bacterium]MYE96399.1 penicillin-binding protein 2 [Acidimicrobiaceae bacterium]MYH42351.1 penicillin-binding protein 2 [Acidimicrobiaceae bacterium]MYI53618.1 penicillin-binding protein 2 [Acidimicrobiaceae bacterium]MYJ43013.1 penicillin-binding protein 2 [Acidimicrobiaceae bacterium]
MTPPRRRLDASARHPSRSGSTRSARPTAPLPLVSRPRVATVLMVLALAVGGLVYRIVDVQATPDPRVLEEVSNPLDEIVVPAPRGTVFDRNGRAIALSLPAATVVSDPRIISDPRQAAADLSEVMGIEPEALLDRLQGDGAFRYVARQVDADVGEQVDGLGIEGIRVISEPRREHPNGGCSALAAVGRVNIDHAGMSGIEETHDEHLSGTPGRVMKEVGVDGTTIPGGLSEVTAPAEGRDITLTLDRNVQYQAESMLLEAVAAAGAASGVALVAMPATGEIVAMANVARGDNGIVDCTRHNLAATWSYEPGSVFKPVTAAAALSSGAVAEHLAIEVPSYLTIWEHRFEDTPTHPDVEWTPTQIVARSSNIGTINMALRAGEERMYRTMRSFGFGTRTALDFKGESKGILPPLGEWSGLSLPNMAIGQGLAVTPLQILQAYNTIANGGVLVPLKLIGGDNTGTGAGPVEEPAPVRVLSGEVAATLMRMLTAVVEAGTGRQAHVEGFSMAGKTGTAWQPCDIGYECVNDQNELVGRHHTATFAGIVSNDDGPALVVLVVIDQPKGERISGGKLAAPTVSRIAEYALRQLRFPAELSTVGGERRRADPAVVPPPPTLLADQSPDAGGSQT